MKNIAIVLAAIILLAAGMIVLTRETSQKTPDVVTQSTQQNQSGQDSAEEGTVITYDGNEFSPETLKVKAGDTVTIQNDSSRSIQFESDPHPAHTDNTELNVSTIQAGQSKSLVTTRTGTFGYHDHLNPNATGTIIIE